ncbi:hypothetical protein ACP4OV_028583 [Aristida adscensionis]
MKAVHLHGEGRGAPAAGTKACPEEATSGDEGSPTRDDGAATTPHRPDDCLKNRGMKRSASDAFGHDDRLFCCTLCQKKSMKDICMKCVAYLSRELTIENIMKAFHRTIKDDLFEDEQETCCMSVAIDGNRSYLNLEVQKQRDHWCIFVDKRQSWASIFDDIQPLIHDRDTAWIPLECPCDARCTACCDGIRTLDQICCTFRCKVAYLRVPEDDWFTTVKRELPHTVSAEQALSNLSCRGILQPLLH